MSRLYLASSFRVGLLFLASGVPGCAQGLLAGVKAGVPVTAYFQTGAVRTTHESIEYSAATRRYTVGLSAEWRITDRLGLELDALYKRMGYVGILTGARDGVLTRSSIDTKGNSWEFPLLLKYRFSGAVRPYAAAGGVLRYIGPIRGRGEVIEEDLATGTSARTPIDTTDPVDVRKRLYPGLAVGGGVEFGTGRLLLMPEVRYTRWTANISGAGGQLHFSPNQVEILLGVLF